MKKIMSVFAIVLLLGTLSLPADTGKEFTLFGNLGVAFSDFEGLFVDLGAEFRLTEKIFIQALLDYYFNPSGESAKGFSDSAFGINAYAVYKKLLKNNLTLFAKAGIHLTSYKIKAEYMGFGMSESSSDLGVAVGAGLEYKLKKALSLVAGLTFKTVFADETGSWFKVYAGVNYALTKK